MLPAIHPPYPASLLVTPRYPGPHATTDILQPFLQAVQPHLPLLSPAHLQPLGTAVAALKLKPGAAWRHTVAAAAADKLDSSSMPQLVQLLLGVTAGGHNPQEHWWRAWFAATMRKCEGLFGSHTGPDWSPPATAAGVDNVSSSSSSSSSGSSGSSSGGTVDVEQQDSSSNSSSGDEGSSCDSAASTWGSASDTNDGDSSGSSSSSSDWQQKQQQQQRQQQFVGVGEALPGGLLSSVCLVLLQLQRQVHPLWMAGMLEAYLRCVGSTL